MFKKIIQWIKNNWDYVKNGNPKSKAEHFGYGQLVNWPLLFIGLWLASITGWYWIPITIQIGILCGTIGWEVNQAWGNWKDWLSRRVLDSFNDVSTANVFTSTAVLGYLIGKFLPYSMIFTIWIVLAAFIGLFVFIWLVQLTIREIKKQKELKRQQTGKVI